MLITLIVMGANISNILYMNKVLSRKYLSNLYAKRLKSVNLNNFKEICIEIVNSFRSRIL